MKNKKNIPAGQKSTQNEIASPHAPSLPKAVPAQEHGFRSRPGKVYHFLTMGAATVIVLAGVKAASGILAPMLLALFLTIILLVPLRWLREIGCPNFISLILVLGSTLMLFVGITYFVGRSANSLLDMVPVYKERIIQKLDVLESQFEVWGFALFREEDARVSGGGTAESGLQGVENAVKKDKKADGETETGDPAQGAGEETPLKQETEAKSPSPSVVPEGAAEPAGAVAVTSGNAEGERAQPEGETSDGEALKAGENAEVEAGEDDEKKAEDKPAGEAEKADAEDKPEEKPEEKTGGLFHTDDDYDLMNTLLGEGPSRKQPLIALDAKSVVYWTTQSLLELRNLAGYSFLVMIFTLFMIFEAARFPEKVDLAFGKEGPIGNIHFHHIANEIRRYLFLKAISSLMSATAATAVYFAFGVPATLFWGLVAFFLYFIPNIGGIVASIIPGLLIFMTYDVQGVLLYAVCLVAIECTIGYGIEPRMLGHGLGISTVVILMSLFFWGWILGLVGFFLAAPLTIMVKIVLQAFKETEWIAVLIGDKTALPHEAHEP